MDNTIGQRIRQRRMQLNITQTQIQEKTGISSGNLSGMENGKYLPSTAALLELSKILNCSIDWILTGESQISENHDITCNTDLEYQLLNYYRGMNETDQEDLLLIAEMKYNKEKVHTKKLSHSNTNEKLA